MSKLIRIPVSGGLMTHAGTLMEVVMREPSYDEFIDLGEIETYGKAPDGTIFMVENKEILRDYISKCLVEPKDPLLLGQGGVKLARAVKAAVLGFFRDDHSADEPSQTLPTTSSLNASPDAFQPTP